MEGSFFSVDNFNVFRFFNEKITKKKSDKRRIYSQNLWFSKRFSNPVNCGSLKTVRAFLRRQCRKAFTFIPRPRAMSEQPPPGKKFAPPNKPAAFRSENSRTSLISN